MLRSTRATADTANRPSTALSKPRADSRPRIRVPTGISPMAGMVAASVAVLVHVWASGNTLFGFPPILYLYGVVLSVFCTVIPTYLVTEGVRRIGAGDAAILGAIGPVATIILEYLVLGEHLTTLQGLGAVLVIVGVVIIGRGKK